MRQRTQLGVIFAVMGGASAALPATIPLRANQLGAPINQLMPSIPALFLGLALGIAFTPLISRLMNTTNHVRSSLALQTVGVMGIGFLDSHQLFIISALIIGFGFGQLEVLITSIARNETENLGNLLTRLGIYLAATAFLTPIAIIGFDLLEATKVIYLLLASISIYLMTVFSTSQIDAESKNLLVLKLANVKVYLLVFAIAFYVGAETILAGWSAVLFSENISDNLVSAPLGTSIFWFSMTLGRIMGTFVSSKNISPKISSTFWSLCLSLSLLFFSRVTEEVSQGTFLLILVIATFFAGPCYGFIIGLAVGIYEQSLAVKSAAFFVFVGSFGGVIVPAFAQIFLSSDSKGIILGAAIAATLSTLFLILSFREMAPKYPQS